MTGAAGEANGLAARVAALPERYQPIHGHPELGDAASRACADRFLPIARIHDALARDAGRPLRVLDLGCAQGWFSIELALRGASVTGIDAGVENIALCRALAAERPSLALEFRHAAIEDELAALAPGAFDLVLGLSVFHHLVHQHGAPAVAAMLARLAPQVAAGVFELALPTEPPYWAPAQPADPRTLLDGFAFVHELGRCGTHLSTIERPLYFASSVRWCFDGDVRAIVAARAQSHALEGGAYFGTRRFYEAQDAIAKLFRIDGAHADANRAELAAEAAYLATPLARGLGQPRVLEHGSNVAEAWLVRERVPGRSLLDALRDGSGCDARRVVTDVLDVLVALEAAGLYHQDVRAWNVLVRPDGGATLIDYGAIGPARADCVWPDDPVLAFWLFVHDVATGMVERIFPQRRPLLLPDHLPPPFRDWARRVWARPASAWTFRLLRDALDDATPTATDVLPAAAPLWMAAIERHLDNLGAYALRIDGKADGGAARLAQLEGDVAAVSGAVDRDARVRTDEAEASRAAQAALMARVDGLAGALELHAAAQGASRAALDTRLATVDGLLVAVDRRLATVDGRLAALDTAAAVAVEREARLGDALLEMTRQATVLRSERDQARAALASIESSRSWRMTRPLRALGGALRRAWRALSGGGPRP